MGFACFVGVCVVWFAAIYHPRFFRLDDVREANGRADVISALFSGLAFAGVIVALCLQIKELGLQPEELTGSREELRRTAEAQAESVTAQRESVAEMRKQVYALLNAAEINAITLMISQTEVDIARTYERDVDQAKLKKREDLNAKKFGYLHRLELLANRIAEEIETTKLT